MATTHDAHTVGARVEELLDEIGASGDPATTRTAEELVRTVMEFYGAGVGRIVELLGAAEGGGQLMRRLADDELVGGLLVLHELHPLGTEERVSGALEKVRPYLGSHSGDVALLAVTDDVVYLRLEGSCHGCPSSMVTVKLAIEQAIEAAAPEVVAVRVEGAVEEPETGPGGRPLLPLQAASGPQPDVGGEHGASWVDLDVPEAFAAGQLVSTTAAGVRAVVCDVDGDLYAYRDRCPGCGSRLSSGTLLGRTVSCVACGSGYDVRLAGKETGEAAERHLDPLPLLAGDGQVRVAVPTEVGR